MIRIRTLLDTALGAVSMYRLVLLCLVALTIQSFVFAAVGLIYPTPAQLAASLAVLLASSYLSNRLFARILRVSPHSESALITGFILFFVAFPALDPLALCVLALAGAAASASKYVIAIRGRHLLNPAAAGIALVSAAQLASSSWWIGTPPALPLVAITTFLILYRTRNLGLGLVFTAVATAGFTAYLMVNGMTDPLAAVWFALGSYPIVFFAGFMLSEPLTLPARTGQKLLVALVVGVFVGWPVRIAEAFLIAPEFALLIGNLIAAVMNRPQTLRMRLQSLTQLTPTSYDVTFSLRRPLQFRAGQYLEITIPHRGADLRGLRRMFSITSVPGAETVSLGVKIPTDRRSTFKEALLALPVGSAVLATGVSGGMTLPAARETPILMIAGGIGITPFVSQIRWAVGQGRDIVLVYAVADGSEIAYADLPDVRVVLMSSSRPEQLPAGWEYGGSGRIDGESLLGVVPDAAARHTMVSGSPAFVESVAAAARKAGARQIVSDPFFGS